MRIQTGNPFDYETGKVHSIDFVKGWDQVQTHIRTIYLF